MHARAARLDLTLRREGDELWVHHPDGRDWRLSRVAEAVWRASDGTRPVALLARIAEAQVGSPVCEETVWSTLGCLADARLLERRVTPPAGAPGYRGLLHPDSASLVVPAEGTLHGAPPAIPGDLRDDEGDDDSVGPAHETSPDQTHDAPRV